jgi:hypothetical protein
VLRETRKPRDYAKKARRPDGMYRPRGEEPRQYYRVLLRGAHAMYRSSVEKSTRKTYKTAEKYWVKLTKRIGTEPYMRTKNPAWLAADTSFANTTITWEETCVLAFLESTRHKPQKLTPNTAFNYLSAIRKFLQDGGVATDFMATSQYIRNTKAAIKIAYRIETGITVKDTVRMPVSMDMIQGHHTLQPSAENTP